MKPYAFGVDIGGTTIKMGFFDTEGKFLDKWEITTRTENNGEKVLPDIARSIKKKLKENELTLDDLEGVGVGVPGPVLSGGIVNQCVNLGWGVIDVRKELSSLSSGTAAARDMTMSSWLRSAQASAEALSLAARSSRALTGQPVRSVI